MLLGPLPIKVNKTKKFQYFQTVIMTYFSTTLHAAIMIVTTSKLTIVRLFVKENHLW